jgi:hypothetical protein
LQLAGGIYLLDVLIFAIWIFLASLIMS